MKKNGILIIIMGIIHIFFISCTTTKDLHNSESGNRSYILNTIGSSQYSSSYWKPHSFGFSKAKWSISFEDKAVMFLNNAASEFGHIACGAWWTPNFLYEKKLSFKNVKSLVVSVDLYLSETIYNSNTALLRMAVASAIFMQEASKYTELDFWDSPALDKLLYPYGDKYFNGSDEYSYKTNQIPVGQWITLTCDFLPYIKASWSDLSNASLESIYIVIESDCRKQQNADTVSLYVRNLIIQVVEYP